MHLDTCTDNKHRWKSYTGFKRVREVIAHVINPLDC